MCSSQPEVIKERPASPKFVVTLDGVDPASMHRSQTDEEVDMQIDEDLPKTVVRVAPHRILTSTPELATEYTDLDFSKKNPLYLFLKIFCKACIFGSLTDLCLSLLYFQNQILPQS